MVTRHTTDQPAKQLESWESWPLWALGLSNGLNIVLWYVLSMVRVNSPEMPIGVPLALAAWLPLIVVLGGIAQAIALDGALIATIAGARHGRRGIWTWLTIIGACLFSAAISYAVHSGQLDQLPALHVASAIILGLYNAHLAQPRKVLQSEQPTVRTRSEPTIAAKKALPAADRVALPIDDGFHCKKCDHVSESLAKANQHARQAHKQSI